MKESGYVYVLMNPSLVGMVKIGKTTRDVEERAKELSASTGVPTPFTVVYDAYFEDCDAAEKYVHTLLSEKGFRVSEHREFFEIPIKDAIDAVILAQNELKNQIFNIPSENEYDNSSEDESEISLGEHIFDQAFDFLHGLNGQIEDDEEAFQLFNKSLKLGYYEAALELGYMYENGFGVKENIMQAIRFYKDAANNGIVNGYAKMAVAYYKIDKIENSKKLWSKYFSLVDEKPLLVYAISNYLDFVIARKQNIEYSTKLLFKRHEEEIIGIINKQLSNSKDYQDIKHHRSKRKLLKDILSDIPAPKEIFPLEKEPELFSNEQYLKNEKEFDIAGYILLGNNGYEKDVEKGMKLLEEACDNGYISGYSVLGTLYKEGNIVEENFDYAEMLFKKGIEKGNQGCIADIAYLYYQKDEIELCNDYWHMFFSEVKFLNYFKKGVYTYLLYISDRNNEEGFNMYEFNEKIHTYKNEIDAELNSYEKTLEENIKRHPDKEESEQVQILRLKLRMQRLLLDLISESFI